MLGRPVHPLPAPTVRATFAASRLRQGVLAAYPQGGDRVNFADLLDTLGYQAGELVSICWQTPTQPFTSRIVTSGDAQAAVDVLHNESEAWFGVNPQAGPPRTAAGRGKADQITRNAALWVDLDVKQNGCGTRETACAIVDDLSAIIGTRPSAQVASGHGLHAYWPISDALIVTPEDLAAAEAIRRRWHRLVEIVAAARNAKVDNVFDLARVLRVPGSINRKGEPIPVIGATDTGAPLTVDELHERFNEAGIAELDGDREADAETVSNPDGWQYAEQACGYAARMRDGWRTDNPGQRHNWLASQATRIAAAHRNGCLTAELHRDLTHALDARFRELCQRPGDERKLTPREVPNALAYGRQRAAAKTRAGLDGELGGSPHHHDERRPDAEAGELISLLPEHGQAAAWETYTKGKSKAPQVQPVDGSLAPVIELKPSDDEEPLYGDVAALLDGTMPDPPTPTVLRRIDGAALFYLGEINYLYGDPEDGKRWVALAAAAQTLGDGGKAVFVDLDHNGMASVVDRLLKLGAPRDALVDRQRFRYCEPEGPEHLARIVADCMPWRPDVAVVDCVGELMALRGANSDNADEYTQTINATVLPLVRAGAAVILIDHMAKGKDSRAYGAGGTMAKRRKLGGTSIRVNPIRKLVRGKGGEPLSYWPLSKHYSCICALWTNPGLSRSG
jgi:hypothetical protein